MCFINAYANIGPASYAQIEAGEHNIQKKMTAMQG